MPGAEPTMPAAGAITSPSGQGLQGLYDEAYREIEPVYREPRPLGAPTLMFRALNRLSRRFPDLNEAELHALFMGLLRQRPELAARH